MKANALSIVAVVLGLASFGRAATIVSDVADAGVHTGSGTVAQAGDWGVRVGEYFGPSQSLVVPFQLPSLPAGEVFTSATVQFRLHGLVSVPTYNVDLYAVRGSASVSPVASDAFEGAFDAGATLLGNDVFTPSTAPGTAFTSGVAAEPALLTFLNNQYTALGAGAYVFFRLNADAAVPNTNNAYTILTSNAGLAGEKPELVYTSGVVAAVPEPTTVGLLGVAALGLLARRGRQGR